MAKISVENRFVKILIVLIALVVLLFWMVRDIERIYDMFRLRTQGRAVDAEMTCARTYFTHAWPYRVEYQFEINGKVYEEPIHIERRRRDIGAPVTRAIWEQCEETGSISVLYLPGNPVVNMPADLGRWFPVYYLHEVWTLLLKTTIFLLILYVAPEILGSGKMPVDKELLKPWGCFVFVVVYSGLLLQLSLRVVNLVIGISDMDLLDIVVNVLVTFALAVLPVSVVIGIARLKTTKRWKKLWEGDDD